MVLSGLFGLIASKVLTISEHILKMANFYQFGTVKQTFSIYKKAQPHALSGKVRIVGVLIDTA
jgi:hypothetical protein